LRIFYELLEQEVFVDILLNAQDLSELSEGRIIYKDTIVPLQADELFNRKVSVGIICPQASNENSDIWDEELEEEERE
jgi:hypothetical protein